jgi:hypothetical protein
MPRRMTPRVMLLALAVVGTVGILVLTIWLVPDLLTRLPAVGHTAASRSTYATAASRLTAENDVRTPVVAALAVVGAAAITAGVTWRTSVLTLQAQALERRRIDVSEQGQVTDRFTKAIDQVGSQFLDVRIGGIYALERVGRDSARDQPSVIQVLTTFVREHSRDAWMYYPLGQEAAERSTRPDVQAALTVIGRRASEHDDGYIDLSDSDLPRVKLMGGNVAGANMQRANLEASWLAFANFRATQLTAANLASADLANADLREADLTVANLAGANLRSADLRNANLRNANLSQAQLTEADLTGAQIPDTYTEGADFTSARWAPDYEAPPGWRRDPATGCLSRADATPGDSPRP